MASTRFPLTAAMVLISSLAAVSAQTTAQQVLTILAAGVDNSSGTTVLLDASVIGVQNSATTLSLSCPNIDYSDDATVCGAVPAETIVYGPSTYNFMVNDPEGFTFSQDCTFEGTTSAICAESATGISANFPGSSTTDYTDLAYFTVTVTAGGSLLSDASATASPGSTGSSAASQTAGSSAVSSSNSASAGSAAATSTSAASSSGGSAATSTSASTSAPQGSSVSAAASSTSTGAATATSVPEQAFGFVGAAALLLGALFL